MMKRLASLLLCAAVLLVLSGACFVVSAAPAETATFTVTSTNAEVGQKIYVSVTLSADSYFTNATMYLHYDKTAVKYVEDSFTTGYVTPNTAMAMAADHPDKGYVKAAYVSPKSIKKGGEMVLYEFTVLKKIPVTFSLSFDECVGVDENNKDFDVKYVVVNATSNADAAVTPIPTTTSVTTPTSVSTPSNDTAPSDNTTKTTVSGGETDATSLTAPRENVTTPSVQGSVTQVTTANITNRSTQIVTVTNAVGETVGTSVIYHDDQSEQTDTSSAPISDTVLIWVLVIVGVALVIITVIALVLYKKKKK